MKKIKRKGQETQQMLKERFLALLLIGLVPYTSPPPLPLKDPASLAITMSIGRVTAE